MSTIQNQPRLLDHIRAGPTRFFQAFVLAPFGEQALAGLRQIGAQYLAARGQLWRVLSTRPVETDLCEPGACEVSRHTAILIAETMLSAHGLNNLRLSARWSQ